MTFDDYFIEHWGAIFCTSPELREDGVTFVQFLDEPQRYMRRLIRARAGEALLPRQRAVRERVDAETAGQLALPFPETNIRQDPPGSGGATLGRVTPRRDGDEYPGRRAAVGPSSSAGREATRCQGDGLNGVEVPAIVERRTIHTSSVRDVTAGETAPINAGTA